MERPKAIRNCVIGMRAAVVLSMTAMLSTTAYAGTWKQDGTGWWWQENDGSYPVSQWKWIDGNGDGRAECYCFDSSGYLYCDMTTPDGWLVNADGAWVYKNAVQTMIVDTTPETGVGDILPQANLVPINQLENLGSLKKKCTDEEFQAAYNAAVPIVSQVMGESKEQQLMWIARTLRRMSDSGQVSYSMSENHYNDPYGYLVLGAASCAGCTRATGLCLNMLGIPYEHVNENQYSHQWCRVNIDGTYWICDAYGLYVGPEPAPYAHPISSPEYSESTMMGLLPFIF